MNLIIQSNIMYKKAKIIINSIIWINIKKYNSSKCI